ncbi:MAG: MEDS domain-containing protein [Thermotogota bacterium]
MITYKKIDNLDKMKAGDHIVLFYKKESEILSASVSFIKTSLNRNEKCLYIKGDLNDDLLLIELRNQITNLDLFIEKGQLHFLNKEETYALSDNFKSDQMIERLKKESKKALREGYKGLSITGELSWALNFENGKKEIIDYEWKLNKYIFNDYPVVAMCRYNLNKFDSSIIKAIIELHHFIIWQGKIHENPYYIVPEGYRDNKIIEYEIESWLENIQKYKKRESIFKEELKKSETKYQKLFNSAPIGIVTTSSTGKAFKINKRMANILGFDSVEEALEEYTDLPRDLYVNPERREEFLKLLKIHGEVKGFEYKALKKDGTQIWLSMNARTNKEYKDFFVIEAFVFDITEMKNREFKINEQKEELSASFEEIKSYNEEIMAMNEELKQSFEETNFLNQRFVKMIDLVSNMEDKTLFSDEEFFSDLLKNAMEIIPEADYGMICIINDQKQCEFIDAIGHNIKTLKKIMFDKNLLINKNSKYVNISDNYFFDIDKIENNKEIFLNSLKPIKKSLYVNIIIDGQSFGRLGLDIKENSCEDFTDTSKKVLESFSSLASSFLAFKRYDNLQTNFTKELITSIIKIMEMYDIYTKGHSENVAKLSIAIAKEMHLSKKIIKDTYWAGLVHDIGKLLIPHNIINKPGKLTDEEFDLIKKHPVWGNKALSSSNILNPIAGYILYHHERWDGKGYPEALKGSEIPLISQILAVADAWDAMSSKRSYRDSLSFDQALKEIKTNKGTQFSPKVVEAFVKIVENNRIENIQQIILDNEINDSKNEKQLLKSKVISEEFFEKANEGIVILDENFNIIRANIYFVNMFGYDKKKIVGEKIKKIVPKNKNAEIENHIDKLSQGKNITSKTIREKENGEIINVSVQGFPIFLDGGNIGYYIIYRDISELEEAKLKYKNLQQRYQALFENKNTVMLIIDPVNGEIVDANPAAEIFYGWSKKKLTSMKITDINILSKEEIEKEMLRAKEKDRNYFVFKHRTANDKIKDVEVYSHPIPFAEKEYLYSIIHEKQNN